MEPFRDDREAAARRIQELESENRALKHDLFVQKAPPPVVQSRPGLAPALLVLFIAVPILILLIGAGAAFFFFARSSAIDNEPRPVRVGSETSQSAFELT